MPTPILMPALSPTMEQGKLSKWLKKEGDKVASGDAIAEIETDKATMEVEAVDEGTIGKIMIPEGHGGRGRQHADCGAAVGGGGRFCNLGSEYPRPALSPRLALQHAAQRRKPRRCEGSVRAAVAATSPLPGERDRVSGTRSRRQTAMVAFSHRRWLGGSRRRLASTFPGFADRVRMGAS